MPQLAAADMKIKLKYNVNGFYVIVKTNKIENEKDRNEYWSLHFIKFRYGHS